MSEQAKAIVKKCLETNDPTLKWVIAAYPTDAKPIKSWKDRDEGMTDVVRQLMKWLKNN